MIEKAVETLKKGGVIAYPTETVYGVGADALNQETINKVFKIKERPENKPISLAVSSWKMLQENAKINRQQIEILKKLLPGPITIIAQKTSQVPDRLTAGSSKVGIRYPNNKIATEIISRYGSPITSTSANKTSHQPPVSHTQIGIPVDHIVEGGTTPIKTSSTIIDIEDNFKILRRGPITKSQIKKAIWN